MNAFNICFLLWLEVMHALWSFTLIRSMLFSIYFPIAFFLDNYYTVGEAESDASALYAAVFRIYYMRRPTVLTERIT